jgi:hypothetical protein
MSWNQQTSSRTSKPSSLVLDRGLDLLLIAGVLVGLVWAALNFGHSPAYGDTPEYWSLSRTLIVDQYRGILYPLFLHAAHALASNLSIPVISVVYTAQLIIAGWAFYSLATLLLIDAPRARLKAALVTLGSLTNPVILHFGITVLTDSLATSFTLLFGINLLRATQPSVGRRALTKALAVAAGSMVLMMLTRPEKAYLAAAIWAIALASTGWFHRRTRTPTAEWWHACWIPFLFLGLAWFTAVGFSRSVTEINPARPPLAASNALFNRVAWPYMEQAYAYFPSDLRQRITLAEARHFDEHANHIFPFVTKTLARSGGQEDLRTITRVTFRHFPGDLSRRISFDFAKYCMPNLSFPLESAGLLPESVATSCTLSRLSMFTPRLSPWVLAIGALQFAAAVLVIGSRHLRPNPGIIALNAAQGPRLVCITFLVLGGIVVVNAGMFALSFSMDSHIRYALPGYAIIHATVLSAALVPRIELWAGKPAIP